MFHITKKNDSNNLSDFFGDSFFDEFFNKPMFKNDKLMRTDLKEERDQYVLDIEVPGFHKEDVKISLEDGYLTVEAIKNENKEEKDQEGNYVRRERYYGNCSRSFYVGDLKEEQIKANLNNGILTIFVPKINPDEDKNNKKYITIE